MVSFWEEVAGFFFQKSIEELSEEELIGLIIMLQSPSVYNPRRFPDKLNEEIDKVREAE